MPDRMDPSTRDAVCEIVRQQLNDALQRRDLEQERHRSEEAVWRAKLDERIDHLVEQLEDIQNWLNHEASGARPRVRMLEENVRSLQEQLRTYSRALWGVGSAAIAAIVKVVVDLIRDGQP